jgi:gamma-glutamylputrescine oxidase
MDYIPSYWSSTTNPHKAKPSLVDTLYTDVVIIGGGFTGLATAYHLRKRGVKAVVLEQNRVGWGASGRNAGMLTTGFKKSASKMAQMWGLTEARKFLNISVDCIRLVADIVKEHEIDCGLNDCGSIKAAYKPAHFERLKKEQEYMLNNFNYPTHLIEPGNMSEELNSPLYHGGLIDPHSGSFHPLNYALGLAEVIEELGGAIYEETPVTAIKRRGDQVHVSTPSGEVIANHLVVATNGYTSDITKKLQKTVIPIGSHIITTEPLLGIAHKLIPNNRVVSDTKNFLYYFRMTQDQRLLFGGRVSFDKNKEENEQFYHVLRMNMLDVFPDLKDVKVDFKWGGLTAFTIDMFPHIGQMEDGTYFAMGYCGHGAAMSTLLGKCLAENIINQAQGSNPLEKLPLRTVPLHGQQAKIMNLVGYYYRFRDRIS